MGGLDVVVSRSGLEQTTSPCVVNSGRYSWVTLRHRRLDSRVIAEVEVTRALDKRETNRNQFGF